MADRHGRGGGGGGTAGAGAGSGAAVVSRRPPPPPPHHHHHGAHHHHRAASPSLDNAHINKARNSVSNRSNSSNRNYDDDRKGREAFGGGSAICLRRQCLRIKSQRRRWGVVGAVLALLILLIIVVVVHKDERFRRHFKAVIVPWTRRWGWGRRQGQGKLLHHRKRLRPSQLPPLYQVSDTIQQRNEWFDPSKDPILSNLIGDEEHFDTINNSSSSQLLYQSACCSDATRKVPVRVLLLTKTRPRIYFRHPHDNPTSLMSDEVLNIAQAGFEVSPCFDLLNFTIVPDLVQEDPTFDLSTDLNYIESTAATTSVATIPPMVWIVDMRRYSAVIQGGNYTILEELLVLVNNTLGGVPQVSDNPTNSSQSKPSRRRRRRLVVVFMDFRDYVPETSLCRLMPPIRQLVDLLGPGHVRYVVQQTIKNRKWNYDTNFASLGNVFDPRNDAKCWGNRALLQIPYTARDDVINAVHQLVTKESSTKRILPLGPSFFAAKSRSIDVSHLWEVDEACKANPAVPRVRMQCELRNQVTQTLLDSFPATSYNVRTRIADSLGIRTEVQLAYVQTLVKSKIVVISQRDLWEDSYRLMEGLVSGAMVMTDPMLTLPMGLVDRESIVIYQSLDDLVTLVDYYLHHDADRIAIARRGYEVALNFHRPHHWMERLFFGKVMTP